MPKANEATKVVEEETATTNPEPATTGEDSEEQERNAAMDAFLGEESEDDFDLDEETTADDAVEETPKDEPTVDPDKGTAATKPEAEPEPKKTEPSKETPSKEAKAKEEGEEAPVPKAEPSKAEQSQPEQQQPQLTPEQYREYLGQVETAAVDQLTQHYAGMMDDETIAALQEEPEKVLPKLAAKVYWDAVTQALAAVRQQLPSAIAAYTQQSEQGRQGEEAFYSTWPKLREADPSVVRRIGMTYRQQNPQASSEEFIRDVGAAAMIALKLSPEEQQAQPQTEQSAPDKPFVPAQGRGGSPKPTAQNVFEQLDEEFDDDDF